MIKLNIQEYCQDCESFEPVADRENICMDTVFDSPIKVVNTTVTCLYQRRCAAMVRYLKKKVEKEESNDPVD